MRAEAYEFDGGPSGIFWEATGDDGITHQYRTQDEVLAAYPDAVLNTLEAYYATHCRVCGLDTEDGEGWDGLCGTCADIAARN